MRMMEMCESERPREKLYEQGAQALSKAELIAVLLRTGVRGESALELGHKLLSAVGGNLVKLAGLDVGDLCMFYGISEGKAASIVAALELGRRFVSESTYLTKIPVTKAGDIYKMMLPHMKGLDHEECWIVLLNNARYPVAKIMLSSGGASSTVIDIKKVIRAALDNNAQALILVHNHPSGNPIPGKADIRQTEALKKAAESMDLQLLDHVIVCDDYGYSFADEEMVR